MTLPCWVCVVLINTVYGNHIALVLAARLLPQRGSMVSVVVINYQ